MPILNYTTTIADHKTVGQIQGILAGNGARSINIDYDAQGRPVAVTFLTEIQGQPVNFRLPSRWQGVLTALEKDPGVPKRLKTEEQARRVAWRIVKDWIAAQMAIINAGLAELAEVFLPYAINPRSGQTLFQDFQSNQLLTAGPAGPALTSDN